MKLYDLAIRNTKGIYIRFYFDPMEHKTAEVVKSKFSNEQQSRILFVEV